MSLGGGGDAQSSCPDGAKKLGVQSKISIAGSGRAANTNVND